MPTQNKFAVLLDIPPDEGRLASLLLALGALSGATLVFTQTAAMTLFLSMVGAQALPSIYVTGAIVTLLLTFAFLRLAAHVSFAKLMALNVGFYVLLLSLFYVGFTRTASAAVVFGLPVLFQALANAIGLASWSLANHLFDVPQGKRLWRLIGIGQWLAIGIIGFLIKPLLTLVDPATLLLLGIVMLAAELGVR
jgi:hypothetical protein